MTAEQFAAAGAGMGLPPDAAGELAALFERVLDGRNGYLSDDVKQVLGRPATDFADFAKSAAGAWVS